jgi:hypothetical protein
MTSLRDVSVGLVYVALGNMQGISSALRNVAACKRRHPRDLNKLQPQVSSRVWVLSTRNAFKCLSDIYTIRGLKYGLHIGLAAAWPICRRTSIEYCICLPRNMCTDVILCYIMLYYVMRYFRRIYSEDCMSSSISLQNLITLCMRFPVPPSFVALSL